ncbi:MAG TPA: hypothetical protein VIM02_15475 [Rhizomicrobium sp.]|jgi:hypothetical protein
MNPACALIFASLCISQHNLEITNTFSMVVMKDHGFNPEAVKRRGLEIEAMESDSIETANSLFLNRACGHGWCLYYRRKCQPTSCRFEVSDSVREDAVRGPVDFATNFEIHARTKARLQRFMKSLIVTLGERGQTPVAFISLSRLDRETRARAFSCSASVWYEGCPRPRFPMMKRPARV